MASLNLTPNEAAKHGIAIRQDGVRRSASDLLSLPEVDFAALAGSGRNWQGFAPDIVEQLEIDAQYAGYLDRQDADILAFRRDEGRALPAEPGLWRRDRPFQRSPAEAGGNPPRHPGPGRPDRRRHLRRPHPGSGPCEGRQKGQKCLTTFGPEEFAAADRCFT